MEIMDSHKCVESLKAGCDQLGLPTTAARELVRFLFVKRCINDENSSKISPSAKLDKLWHWMLLETDIRDSVEKLVGRVAHSQNLAVQDDKTKLLRRCPWPGFSLSCTA